MVSGAWVWWYLGLGLNVSLGFRLEGISGYGLDLGCVLVLRVFGDWLWWCLGPGLVFRFGLGHDCFAGGFGCILVFAWPPPFPSRCWGCFLLACPCCGAHGGWVGLLTVSPACAGVVLAAIVLTLWVAGCVVGLPFLRSLC